MVEMATGRNPWDGEAACITTFKRDLKQGRTPTIPNHLSLECRQIIDTCLKSDSTDRPTLELLKEAAFLKKF
jgi:serine/threonine protein kinase